MRKSTFVTPFEKNWTGNFGYAYPIVARQLHPGMVWRQDVDALVRTQPLLSPVMGRMKVTMATYFCPNRILNDTWEDFITGGLDGDQSPAAPTITAPAETGWLPGSLPDMLNHPVGVPGVVVNAYKVRAYGEVYNNYIRDEQLMPAITVSKAAGPDTTTNILLKRAAWRRDYLTKARPQPQLGAAVAIPLLGNAPVSGTAPVMGIGPVDTQGAVAAQQIRNADGTSTTGDGWATNTAGIRIRAMSATGAGASNYPQITADASDALSTMEADLSLVAGPTVEEIRELSAIQRFKEAMNNTGARYVEYLQRFFGISPQDARLNLPEYLGGGEFVIQTSEVLGTTNNDDTVIGQLAGHGIGKGGSRRIKYFVKEHGIIMTIMIIRPDTQYSQGIMREDMYNNKFDYLNPMFVDLGDQEVYKGEVFATGDSSDREVWGYTPRFEELRYIPSTSHGEFLKGQPLNEWTLTRQFDTRPALNAAFVECDGTDRIFAVKDEDQFQVRTIVNVKAKIPLPKHPSARLK